MDTPFNVRTYECRSALEVITAVVETTHTAQEANARGYACSTLFNEN